MTDDGEAAALIASEAADSYALGHRAFKLKVGRGGRWMLGKAGTRCDIAIIRAVWGLAGESIAARLSSFVREGGHFAPLKTWISNPG